MNQKDDESETGVPSSLAADRDDPAALAFSRLSRAMIRNDPEGAREILDGLDPPDRARLVMRFQGRDRRDLILLSSDSRELTRHIPAPELWITIKQTGEEDSMDLIRLAHPSQLQHFFDLEWWYRDELDPLSAAYWVMLIGEAGADTAIEWFRQADEDLLVSVLAKFFRVFRTDPDDEGAEPWRALKNIWTLDNVYYLNFFDPNLWPTFERFLSVIRDREQMKYYGLLDAIEALPASEREHEALRFRTSRMLDFGYVDFDQAMEIYAPLSDKELDRLENEAAGPGSERPGDADSPAPEYPLALSEAPPLLGKALSLIRDRTAIEDFKLGLGALTNRILIADDMDLSKLESVSRALAKVHSFLEMGLVRWSGADPERAARLIETRHAFHLFRAGYTRVLAAARRAHGFIKDGWPARTGLSLDLLGEGGGLIRGLVLSRPRFYGGADDKGAPLYREFTGEDEVRKVESALSRAGCLGTLFFEAMGASGDELKSLADFSLTPLDFETAFLTALGQALAGNGFKFAPLSPGDARVSLELLVGKEAPHRLTPGMAAQVEQRVEDALGRLASVGETELAGGRDFVSDCLARLEGECRELDLARLDPRYFRSMVILRNEE